MKSAARNISDDESGYICEQYYYHYQTEIRKYIFLLMINFMELFGAVSYYTQMVLQTYKYDSKQIANSSIEVHVVNCANVNSTVLRDNQIRSSAIPSVTIFRAFGNVADMFVAGLGVCLMSYLITRMKNGSIPNNIKITRFIIILLVTSIVIILTSYFTFYIILSGVIFLPVLTINLLLFIKYVNKFKEALLQIAFERLSQHGSNKIEMKQYRYFTYNMYCICIGFSLITISAYSANIPRFILSGVFFGHCYFPFNLVFPSKMKLPFSDQFMNYIDLIVTYIPSIEHITAFCGVVILISPFLFITFYTWIVILYLKTRRKSDLQFRYHVNSNNEESMLKENLLKK
ncbi:hypothetical protein LOD99_8977 [Oopsacas minuta]|uniref:Uncharacterized protein n=1 Tax=Oopsacas minuta TaxID=111878 RepID=A0AAV7JDU4_9METZ|nr:hypothetical protein LOD99_8977 [Oopsacas minuta]